MSLGLRLTLVNGFVLLLTITAFATVAYVTQYRSLQNRLDASLREETGRFMGGAAEFFERGTGRPRALVFPNPRAFAAPDVFIQITAGDGATVARSRNLEDRSLPTSPETFQRALQGEEWFTDVEAEGEPLRMFVTPLRIGALAGGAPLGMVQVARPLAPAYSDLNTLQATFLRLGAVSVLLSLAIGWLLARGALRPIDRLADAADAIGAARDFRRRVPVPRGRRDEVGRLAEEFNQMLAQLQSAYEQLESALAAQRRFVADASHELRTPLTSLRGNVELLTRMNALNGSTPNAAEMEEVLGDMAAETERVTRLVGDLLLLARVDAGQHLALAPVELSPLVGDAFRAARFLREGVELRLADVPPGVWLDGNADRLKQLLLILLDNALKYSPSGGHVAIGAGPSVRDGAQGVGIWVEDTGPGIAHDDRERIFERFYRVDATTAFAGAGLGLAIARWIVEEHGGVIEVESQVGQGSTFTVWLPRAEPPGEGAEVGSSDGAVATKRPPVVAPSPA